MAVEDSSLVSVAITCLLALAADIYRKYRKERTTTPLQHM
jgi:hypothetical protein